MQVIINGQQTSVQDAVTVEGLIKHLALEGRIAIEINREIIPKSKFDSHLINDGDIIEIVHAIGGGAAA